MASGTCSHLERGLEWKTAPHMQGKISNMSKLDRHTMPYMGIELVSLGNGLKQHNCHFGHILRKWCGTETVAVLVPCVPSHTLCMWYYSFY